VSKFCIAQVGGSFKLKCRQNLIPARSDFSRCCRVVGDLFRRQKTLDSNPSWPRRRNYFFEPLACAETIPIAILFTIKTPAIDHASLRVQTAAFNQIPGAPIETENAQRMLITC
jgi:hypothetical protein